MKKIINLVSLPLFTFIILSITIVFVEKFKLNSLIISLFVVSISIIIIILSIIFRKFYFIIFAITISIISLFIQKTINDIKKDYFFVRENILSSNEVVGFVNNFTIDKKNRLDFQFRIYGIKKNDTTDYIKVKPFDIMVKVKKENNIPIKRGDVLIIKDNIILPQEKICNFSYKEYLFYQKIYGVLQTKCESIKIIEDKIGIPIIDKIFKDTLWLERDKLFLQLKNTLSDQTYAFLISIFFGIREGLSDDVYLDFQNTGMLHLLAISGMNISFIGTLFLFFLRIFLSKSKAFVISLLLLFCYIMLILYSASSTRAYIMYAIQAIYFVSGMRTKGISILCFCGIFMIFINPFCIFDLGFQLSFLATAGILFFSKIIEEKLPQSIPQKVKSLISVTLSAFSSVFILQWALFQKIQFFSLISSLFVVPLFEYMFIFLFFVLIAFYLTKIFFLKFLIEYPVILFLKIVNLLNHIPATKLPQIPVALSYLSLPIMILIVYLIIPTIYKKIQNLKIKRFTVDFDKKIT